MSIAYGKPEPAVDGNVMRVFSRILMLYEDIAKPKTRKTFEGAVRMLISHENPSAFNQALMELEEHLIVLQVSQLACCAPFKIIALRLLLELVGLPVKTQKKKTRDVSIVAAVVTNEQGEFLIHRTPVNRVTSKFMGVP